MTSSMNSVLGSLRRAREWAYPQLSESAFLEKGVLTPEEFVKAGDELVFRCPTWEWSGTHDTKQKSYLPPDKQYLITRNVPCWNRVSSLETNLRLEGEGEGWMIASDNPDGNDNGNGNGNGNDNEPEDTLEDEFDILGEDGEVVEAIPEAKPEPQSQSQPQPAPSSSAPPEDEYGDMDDYVDEDVLVDNEATIGVDDANIVADGGDDDDGDDDSVIVKTRTYDLSITYDKYYQVPRVWMVGRDENDHPLTSSQMMEDVISDYANKTVTMEIHPHVGSACRHASIHPCQHSKVMKAIVRNLMKPATDGRSGGYGNGNGNDDDDDDDDGEPLNVPSVENYLFIFLKFVSSMIPTINYDFTMDVTADTRS